MHASQFGSQIATALAFSGLIAVMFGCGDGQRQTATPVTASAPTVSVVTSSSASDALVASAAPTASAIPEPAQTGPYRGIDMHVDTAWQVGFKGRSLDLTEGHATPKTLAAGHVDGVFLAIYIADRLHDNKPRISDADQVLGTIDKIVARHPDAMTFATETKGPVEKVRVFLSIEGAGCFADDVTQIDRFIARGVRFVGPVHMADNRLASSATGKDRKGGFSALGKTFAQRVYEKGALIDVSHMSDRSFEDLLPIAAGFGAPIVATHSNARALADHPRNLTDAQLVAIGKSGGVVGVNFHQGYLNLSGTATLADVVKQTLYMVKVAGVDHVGLGSDFDGANPPPDLADFSYLPAFAKALEDAGLSSSDVRKIFSGNVERVLRWKPTPRG